MSNRSSNGGGLFSSITSLFGSATLGEGSSSAGGASTGDFLGRKRSTYGGSSLPTSARRGDGGIWQDSYGPPYGSEPNTATTLHNGAYPPTAVSTPTTANYSGYGSSTTRIHQSMPNATESTATLVPGAQSRTSLHIATNVSIPSTAYPPLKHTWRRIRNWCDKNYTELADTLNWPAVEAQLDDLELTIGFSLPAAVRDSYLCYDGQELESNQSCNDGLFFGLPLLSIDRIAEEWRFWRSVDDDPATGANPEVKGWMCSCPANWVRAEYSCRGWIPLITDHVGNYVGVDLSPNPSGGGSPGQVILFGRDFDTKIVLWRGEGEGGWGRFLQHIAEELESGEMWTLEEEVSNDSNDEEDAIGYESYFSGGGSGSGRGGGDRAGDGAAGFKLRGEYKGWPVLEAWADRSMRCWEEVGMPSGQPAWRSDQPPPSVVLQEAQGTDQHVDEDGEDRNIEGDSGSVRPETRRAPTSSDDATSATSTPARLTSSGQSHPLESLSAHDGSQTSDTDAATSARRAHDTLSPPPMRAPRTLKQKQREATSSESGPMQQQQARPRRAPPAPAAPLDLPTIDDVRAAHAAVMATQQRGGQYHYDVERAARPPPGMGGMGMGMGMSSDSQYLSERTHPYTLRRGNDDARRINIVRDDDGVELESRPSTEAFNTSIRNSSVEQGLVALDDSRRGSTVTLDGSPRVSLNDTRGGGGQTLSAAQGQLGSRTLYSASRSSEAVNSLIDASSSPDVSIQIEGTKAAANVPAFSSPLASQDATFTSSRGAVPDAVNVDSSSAQPLAA